MTKISINQCGRVSKLYYLMKKEICRTVSIACYFLCKNKGKITYTCNFPLSKKKHTKNKSEVNETAYLQEVGGYGIGKDGVIVYLFV